MAELFGSRQPRISSAPLSMATRGPELIAFAAGLGLTFLPWQEELAQRGLETLPDGSYRYRVVTVLAGRQSGKSSFVKALALWRMVQRPGSLVVGAAQSLDISREAWSGAVELAVDGGIDVSNVRRANGEQCLTLGNRSRYRIVATTAGAGRGLSVDLLVMDEARMQRDWHAWSALSKTTIARPGSQTWVISNAGDDESVVLNGLREKGLAGEDGALGLFEWSGDPALDVGDPVGWAQGCPGIGYTVPLSAVEAAFGTDPPAVFRTEILCQHVVALDGAVDMAAWGACRDDAATLDKFRAGVCLGLDVSVDGSHASLVAATVDDRGLVRVETVATFEGLYEASRALPGWVERVRPRALGFLPGGPAAEAATSLRAAGFAEIAGAGVAEACMSLAGLIAAGLVRHAGDELLTAHLGCAERHRTGDTWRFARPRLGGNVDGAYAAAAAVFLARGLPPAPARAFVL